MTGQIKPERRLLRIIADAILEGLDGKEFMEEFNADVLDLAYDAALSQEVELTLDQRLHVCASALAAGLGSLLNELDEVNPYSMSGATLMVIMQGSYLINPLEEHSKACQSLGDDDD